VPYLAFNERENIINHYHQVLGHLQTSSILNILKLRHYWPGLESDIKRVIDDCRECQLNTLPSRENQALMPLHPLPPAPLPFQRWHIDYLQDLPPSDDGYNNCITATDSATRWFIAVPTKNRLAKTTAKFIFDHIISNFGAPIELVSDRSKSFLNEVVEELLKVSNCSHLRTSSYHPRSNGLAERPHSTFNGILTKLCAGVPDKWPKFISRALLAVRTRIHDATGFSPFFLVYGIEPRIPGDSPPVDLFEFPSDMDVEEFTRRELQALGVARGLAHERTQKQAQKMKERYDNNYHTSNHGFVIGEFVKVKNHNRQKFEDRWIGPFIVTAALPNGSYRLMHANGKTKEDPVFHDDMAPFRSSNDE
jgi:hypothetical protein